MTTVIDNVAVSSVDMKARKDLGVRAGDTVRVYQKVQEKDKVRLQVFEGLVLAVKHGTEAGATFTVRKVSSGVGMERVFPLYSPMIEKIEIVRRSKVRRSKLYFIREKAAKEIRRQMRNMRLMFVSSADLVEDAEENAEQTQNDAEEAETDSSPETEAPVEAEASTEEKTEETPKEEEKKEE